MMKFDIHDSDINAVRFFPSGEALGTACSDGTVRADTIPSSIQQYTVVYINMQWCTIVCNSIQECAVMDILSCAQSHVSSCCKVYIITMCQYYMYTLNHIHICTLINNRTGTVYDVMMM